MPRNQLLDALLDRPQYQSLYLHSASFHSSIDMMLGFIPGWVSSIAKQSLDLEAEKETAIRRIEADQPDLKWYLEDADEIRVEIEAEEELPGIPLGEKGMRVIHEIQAEADLSDLVKAQEEAQAEEALFASPRVKRQRTKGHIRERVQPKAAARQRRDQPPAKTRSRKSAKKATAVRKTAQKATKAQKKRVPVSQAGRGRARGEDSGRGDPSEVQGGGDRRPSAESLSGLKGQLGRDGSCLRVPGRARDRVRRPAERAIAGPGCFMTSTRKALTLTRWPLEISSSSMPWTGGEKGSKAEGVVEGHT